MSIAKINDRALILVVDDTPTNLHVMINALSADYEVMIATSGKQALELARQAEKPDLILLDIMMPDMDGFEVCRQLKSDESTRDIPVIFITALADAASEARGLEIGAVDYISKPIRLPIVRARIRTHLKMKHHIDLLASLAMLDGLTGIANRRNFDLLLETEWKRAQRDHLQLSLILADIDCFKLYNDHYGHIAGDQTLRQVAKALDETASRPSDLAARFGGEEFALLLPNTPRLGGYALALRFLERVRQLAIPHEFSEVGNQLTVSAGGISLIPRSDMSASNLVDLTDQLLYRAKREGKNRVLWRDCDDAEI
jgi:diguanylate cyclase (GGDEF)-like protein